MPSFLLITAITAGFFAMFPVIVFSTVHKEVHREQWLLFFVCLLPSAALSVHSDGFLIVIVAACIMSGFMYFSAMMLKKSPNTPEKTLLQLNIGGAVLATALATGLFFFGVARVNPAWVAGIAFLAFIIVPLAIRSSRTSALQKALRSEEGFSATEEVIGIDGCTGIAFDERSRAVLLAYLLDESPSIKRFSYRDMLSSEIVEDSVSITRTSRTSQIGGAALGHLILPGIGTIIGGLSGKKLTNDDVRRLVLRIVVNDLKRPVHEIVFLDSATQRGSAIYRVARDGAERWHAIIDVLIRRADEEDKRSAVSGLADDGPAQRPSAQSSLQRNHSVADELRKLADLREGGLLTAEEFQAQKERLLQ